MSISKLLTNKIIVFVKSNSDKSEEELEIIHYGIEVFLINVFKLIILFITAYFLNILIYTFIAFFSFAVIRMFASGVHANSSIKCILTNYIIFFGNVYLSITFTLNTELNSVIFLISIILILLYAPADTEEKPIVNKNLRKSLKIKSVICIIILTIVSLLIQNKIYANIISYSALEAGIVITPIAYKFFGKSYKNFEKLDS